MNLLQDVSVTTEWDRGTDGSISWSIFDLDVSALFLGLVLSQE